MKTIKGLNKPILALDGTPLTEADGKTKVIVKSIIANAIARGQSEEPAKAMAVALKIYNAKKDEIELEDAEYNLAWDMVRKDQLLNNLAKAAILSVLEEKSEKTS